MKKAIIISTCIFALTYWSALETAAQNDAAENKQVNFRYSKNPKIRIKTETVPVQNATVSAGGDAVKPENSIARKTLEIAKRAAAAIAPTEIYKVGSGDVLFINLQNVSKASSYFTVLNDGTIDYPLTGEMLAVAGLTTDEIEDLLRDKIKLYENPQISVKVRDYSSHSITVLGLVEKSGERRIQREAVPLYLVKADAVVQSKAGQVIVRRSNAAVETLDLKDSKTDDVLIFPGDIVEFASSGNTETAKSNQFYYIGGEINAGGQKDFHSGITLSQAILASGGLRKTTAKKVIIRRKNFQGLLVSTEHNLKNIKDGKEPDPVLQSDDTIEVGL